MKLVVAPLALAELHDAAAFYALKANVELGLAFVAEFERTAKVVSANPLLGVVFRGTRRRYLFRRFPYHCASSSTWNYPVLRHDRNSIYRTTG